MFFFGGLLAVIAGGIVGWVLGANRSRAEVNRQWMSALEAAKVDGIIDEKQSSDIIRIQNADRKGR